jgi:hypothetical protein
MYFLEAFEQRLFCDHVVETRPWTGDLGDTAWPAETHRPALPLIQA